MASLTQHPTDGSADEFIYVEAKLKQTGLKQAKELFGITAWHIVLLGFFSGATPNSQKVPVKVQP